jgi:DNA polymerase III alpha subunit
MRPPGPLPSGAPRAIDESGWISLVGLNHTGFLAGADRGRPRVDWSDLERYNQGVVAITGMPAGGGILSAAIEHSGNPAEPIEAFSLVRRLMELYPDRLYLELAYHGNPALQLGRLHEAEAPAREGFLVSQASWVRRIRRPYAKLHLMN